MQIIQTNRFEKAYKKLHPESLGKMSLQIINNPEIGEQKKGDLCDIRVYKFKMVNQLTLIAYLYEDETIVLTFVAMGSHENFYRDIKR